MQGCYRSHYFRVGRTLRGVKSFPATRGGGRSGSARGRSSSSDRGHARDIRAVEEMALLLTITGAECAL